MVYQSGLFTRVETVRGVIFRLLSLFFLTDCIFRDFSVEIRRYAFSIKKDFGFE